MNKLSPPPAPGASVLDLMSQVRALCGHARSVQREVSAKPVDLRKVPRRDWTRDIITDRMARLRKLALETGYDDRRGMFLKAPLEPWTCPNPLVAMMLYGEIARAEDGALNLDAYSGPQLDHLAYMHAEKLIHVAPSGSIHMLSDPKPAKGKISYPGSDMPDVRAKIGRQLRDKAEELILAAFWNIVYETNTSDISDEQRDLMRVHRDGLAMPVRMICTEANQIKAHHRPDLAEYRFLSEDTCGRVLRKLLARGVLDQLEPPRAVRVKRSWRAIPRSFRIPEDTPLRQLPVRPDDPPPQCLAA